MGVSLPIIGVPGLFGGGAITWNTYAQTFVDAGTLPLWYRCNEASGTTIVNYGSTGSAGNGAISGTYTLAAAGQLGAGEAVTIDGANGKIQTPAHVGINALTSFETVWLVYPTAYASTNLMARGDGAHSTLFFGTSGAIRSLVDCATTDAQAITTTAVKPALLAWSLVFMAYDDTTKHITLRLGTGGTVATLALGTDTAGVGAVAAMGNPLCIMNRQAADAAVVGGLDEFMLFNQVLTAAQRLTLVTLAGA